MTSDRDSLTLFQFEDSRPLADTEMMSTPTMDVAAWEQFGEWAMLPGHDVRVLFDQGGDDGLSLVWSWFGPDFVLPRHTHSADCLYFVVKGEAHLGNRVVTAGGGFFVPADAPYAYRAGPEGIEILEFRNATSFDMKISESLPRWQQILDGARANRERWEEAAARRR